MTDYDPLEAPVIGTYQMQSVFCIEYCGQRGTAFAYHDEQGTYIVTAKHVIKNAAPGDRIGFRTTSETYLATIKDIAFGATHADVAVFSSDDLDIEGLIMIEGTPELHLGQRLIFLGYPHGLASLTPSPNPIPSPLARSAFYSGVISYGDTEVIILDGFNNPGYSGGPIWAKSEDAYGPLLVGLISGYRREVKEHSAVYRIEEGVEVPIDNTYSHANSGMIYAVPRSSIFKVASKLPSRNAPYASQRTK
jgi:S1-C subfamily serine protease